MVASPKKTRLRPLPDELTRVRGPAQGDLDRYACAAYSRLPGRRSMQSRAQDGARRIQIAASLYRESERPFMAADSTRRPECPATPLFYHR